MKFIKLEDVEKILGDIYESMGSSRHNWYDPLRKNDVEEWWWSDDNNNDFVEHAHWIPIESTVHVEKSGACSNCGEAWIITDTTYFYYCPNCGAKMDEEVE